MDRTSKRAIKEVIRQEAEKYTGRPMTNGAAKKWLKKQGRHAKVVEHRPFKWPRVSSFPRPFRGMARYCRFPSLEPKPPFGWKRIVNPPYIETLELPYWIYGPIAAWEHLQAAFWRLAFFAFGFRRVA